MAEVQQKQVRMNKVITEITNLSDKDCFYLAERYKEEFSYPLHKHEELELNFVEHCQGARRIVGDSMEVLGEYDLCLSICINECVCMCVCVCVCTLLHLLGLSV